MSEVIVQKVNETAAFLKAQYDRQPQAAIILGSGLGNFVQKNKGRKGSAVYRYTEFPRVNS